MDGRSGKSAKPQRIFRRIHRTCHGDLLGLDLFDPCSAGCLHCRHGRNSIEPPRPIADDLPLLVARELERRRRRGKLPAFLVLGAHSEPFPASIAGQRITLAVLREILDRRIGLSIETRGTIPDETIEILARHRSLVRVRVAVFAGDRHLQSIWEPGTADLETRFFVLRRLREAAVPTVCHLGPIVPTVNDSRPRVEEVFATAADIGIRRVTTEILRAWPGLADMFAEQIPGRGQLIMAAYRDRTIPSPRQRSLPDPEYRRRLYEMLHDLAFKYHRQLGLCRCADKEFGNPPCNLGFGTKRRITRQLGLFTGSGVPSQVRPSPRSGPSQEPILRRRPKNPGPKPPDEE